MFWTKLSLFLVGITDSVVGRVMLALGMSVVSFGAATVISNQIVETVQANYGQLTGVTLQILNLAGAGQGLGIICSAFVTKSGFAAAKMWRHTRFIL